MGSAPDTDCRTAEWSFQYLRRQAQEAREDLIKRRVEQSYTLENNSSGSHPNANNKRLSGIVQTGPVKESEAAPNGINSGKEDSQSVVSSTSVLEGQDVISFRAQWNGNIGRLIVYSSGIRFVRSLPKKELWNRPFLDLVEMRKLQDSTVSKLTTKGLVQLEFTCTDGATLLLGAMKDRDEAFNTIIGFSGLQWQVLQKGPGKHGNGTNSGPKS